MIFVSYAMKDSQLFNIREIAEILISLEEIDDVLYREEDTKDNFIKYMNEYVGKCDMMILFCSPNTLQSEFVQEEWMVALAMKKFIIPIFIKPEHIPSLLKARLGVEYDTFDLHKNLDNLYKDILKKSESTRIE